MTHSLSTSEREHLRLSIAAALSIPFIDDIEDYIWESIFSYVKNIPFVDPLISTRSKRLFDVVDNTRSIGWSAKALQWNNIQLGARFELVVQRADIFKKAPILGFKPLNKNSSTTIIGEALLKHWIQNKIKHDAEIQKVSDKRVCILLKSKDRTKFAFFDENIYEYSPKEIEWRWSNSKKNGLQGIRRSDNACVFRWYPNQKQLFESFVIPDDAFIFVLEPKRLEPSKVVSLLTECLNKI